MLLAGIVIHLHTIPPQEQSGISWYLNTAVVLLAMVYVRAVHRVLSRIHVSLRKLEQRNTLMRMRPVYAKLSYS